MIETLFRKHDDRTLTLDYGRLLEQTDKQFLDLVTNELLSKPVIEEMKYQGSRKQKFAYFRVGKLWYSLAYDVKNIELIFSRKTRERWTFIVGHKRASADPRATLSPRAAELK